MGHERALLVRRASSRSDFVRGPIQGLAQRQGPHFTVETRPARRD
jgi:hypothetical protein